MITPFVEKLLLFAQHLVLLSLYINLITVW